MEPIASANQQSELVQRQASIVERIFCLKNANSEGVKIYQNNLLFTAARALSISYPVLEKLLGQETIIALAQRLLQQELPNSGDWADWGEQLSGLIQHTQLAQEHPYLSDMAQLEWQLHRLARHKPSNLEFSSLKLLETQDLANVWITLNADISLYYSEMPIDQIWLAHKSLDHIENLDSKALADAIREHPNECFLLLHQMHNKPTLQRISESEFRCLEAITQGVNVERLLDQHADFDFVQWFAKAVEHNWIKQLSAICPV
ncbi:HvfC/BufC family peptide modification chaperone [Pseudoteredinibacter isoporae]|uniref:HvfC/BufC family peptide modification chaperone n=1 Tax=Pseudoteredinibacter isoporae TaxID=570281 RepID=UPI00310C8005